MKTKTDWEKEEETRKKYIEGYRMMYRLLIILTSMIFAIAYTTTTEQRAEFIARRIGQEVPNYSDYLVLLSYAPTIFCVLYPLSNITRTMTAGIQSTLVLSIAIITCATTLISHLYMAKAGWVHITVAMEELEALTKLGMKSFIDSLIVLTTQRIYYTIARYKYGDNY